MTCESHTDLVGLSDLDLLMRCGTATHQHYKGGLYRQWGKLRDADTGEPVMGKDGQPRIVYEHMYPHPREFWLRDASEWFDSVQTSETDPEGEFVEVPRFRPLR